MSLRYIDNVKIIPKSEYERMRRSVSGSIETYQAERKKLKELSNSKIVNWKNTAMGDLHTKQARREERAKLLELERQEIDKKEEECREQYRKETIERANRLTEEETDRMKTLRSKTMLVDVLIERDNQIEWNKQKREMEKKRDEYYYNEVLKSLAKEKERDDRERAERKRKEEEAKRMYIIFMIVMMNNQNYGKKECLMKLSKKEKMVKEE